MSIIEKYNFDKGILNIPPLIKENITERYESGLLRQEITRTI